jgi:NADPH2:quinone reductase
MLPWESTHNGAKEDQAMKAAALGPRGLEIRELPRPQVKPSQVLVRVHYASLNRRDLTRGKGDEGTIPGLDWAGEIAEAGAAVKHLKPGDRVLCMGSGGYAEYAVTEAGHALKVPPRLDLEQAATLPVALFTMHDALVTNGGLRAGESVLVQGASSGVGLMGLQIAKLWGASLVIGSSRRSAARLNEFGADLALSTDDPAWVQTVAKATGGRGVDLVIDQVSGKLFNQTQHATAIGGRIVNVGRLGGMLAEFDFNLHALRRLRYIGVTFRTRSRDEVAEIARRVEADLGSALDSGKLRLPVDRVFSLDDAEAAQARMRADQHFGKILLRAV